MKGKRYSAEQIIGILKEHVAGMQAQDVVRKAAAYQLLPRIEGSKLPDYAQHLSVRQRTYVQQM